MLKTVKADTPTPKDLAVLRREYEVLKDLKVDGVVKAVELVTFGHGLALVLEDFKNGEILRQVHTHGLCYPNQQCSHFSAGDCP